MNSENSENDQLEQVEEQIRSMQNSIFYRQDFQRQSMRFWDNLQTISQTKKKEREEKDEPKER